jgi:hypothetical protein
MAINLHDVAAFATIPVSDHYARLFLAASVFLALRARRGGSLWPKEQPVHHRLRWRHWGVLPDGTGGVLSFPSTKTGFHVVTPVFYPALIGSSFCPILLARELRSRAPSHIPTGDDDLMFILPSGQPLSRKWMLDATRRALKRVGRPCIGHLSSKSWRRGLATHASSIGLPEAAVMQLGTWKSACWLRYCDLDRGDISRSINAIMASSNSSAPIQPVPSAAHVSGDAAAATPSLQATSTSRRGRPKSIPQRFRN